MLCARATRRLFRLPMKKNNAVNNYDQSCRRRDRQMDHPGTRARRRRQAS